MVNSVEILAKSLGEHFGDAITDANDALAVAIASTQFGMVFSQIKEEEQQSLQTLETSRKICQIIMCAQPPAASKASMIRDQGEPKLSSMVMLKVEKQ